MRRFAVWLLIVLTVWPAVVTLGAVDLPGDAAELVYVVPITGEIDFGLAAFVRRGIAAAEQERAAVLLEINTFGGLLAAAAEIRDAVVRARVPVISYVTDRAWSAGALIALAAPKIAMAPGSSMGAAEPRPADEKTVSAVRAEFESTAERTGRNPLIAAAMVDADVVVEDLSPQGKILTLSAQNALDEGFADVIAASRQEALAHFGLAQARVEVLRLGWAEHLARFVTNSVVSSLLLTLGFLGLIFEITTPGWGVPGTGGLLSLALFFGGRYLAGLVGIEAIGLFVLGLILLLIEVFVIPGFGITGVLGLIGMAVGIIMAFGNVKAGLIGFTIALTASIVAIVLLWQRIVSSRFFKKLILTHREEQSLGYQGPRDFQHLLGKSGITLTPLRPAGTALIDGERYDVVSEGGFLDPDTPIHVIRVEGTRIVVREIGREPQT